ncbi:hypothetical protein BofuT4_P050730.1 [Botrytis cinerea T4]|uniref:Uncharacterized protein n=1 Tax=Botryotinia fuckeliana (strain T4) TaxID=999810 RepID=G2XWX7_BOTF4|nr:hypothetical protein BofuT4_P050730.1 [Botrytis cinerea T4]
MPHFHPLRVNPSQAFLPLPYIILFLNYIYLRPLHFNSNSWLNVPSNEPGLLFNPSIFKSLDEIQV